MNFILVWVLVSSNAHGVITYSPPMQTQNECVILKSKIRDLKRVYTNFQCVQITMGVAK